MIIFPLTEADVLDRAQALAEICDAITELEDEKKEVADAFKQRMHELRKEQARLSKAIQSGKELRDTAEQLELPTEMPPDPSETFPAIHDSDSPTLPGVNEELTQEPATTKPRKKGAAK
jgi:hypothetical protein